MRTSTGSAWADPTRWIIPVWMNRSSLTWSLSSISQISSRNSVPPSAALAAPIRFSIAPVKAPLTWPKSSLSSRFSGMAPQLIATKALFRRRDSACSASAVTSLPVPLSPVTKTLARESATCSIVRNTARMTGDWPIKPWKRVPSSTGLRTALAGAVFDCSTAARIVASRRVPATGLTKKSKAPSRIAAIARDSEPSAVMTTKAGEVSSRCSSSERPSPSGNCKSSSAAENCVLASASRASASVAASATSYPASSNWAAKPRASEALSSMIRMAGFDILIP